MVEIRPKRAFGSPKIRLGIELGEILENSLIDNQRSLVELEVENKTAKPALKRKLASVQKVEGDILSPLLIFFPSSALDPSAI